MKACEIRGRHLLGCELDEVGAVGAGASSWTRLAPGAQRGRAALLGVEPR